MNMIDALMLGWMGGLVGSVTIIATYYCFITHKTNKFLKTKLEFKNKLMIVNLRHEIKDLQELTKEINSELLEMYTNHKP